MKIFLLTFALCLTIFFAIAYGTHAATPPSTVKQGGTGWGGWVAGTIPIGPGTGAAALRFATSSGFTFATSTNTLTASNLTVTTNAIIGALTGLIGGNSGSLYGLASSSLFGFTPAPYPFTQVVTYGTTTSATTSPLYTNGGFFASTTSSVPSLAITQAGTGPAATFMGGNVGIGTTAPATKLDVNVGSNGYIQIFNSGNGVGNGIRLVRNSASDWSGVNYYVGSSLTWAFGENSNGFGLFENGSGSNTRLLVKPGGNVGIASTSPGRIFSVQGDSNISGDLFIANLTATGTATLGNIINNGVSANQVIYTSNSKQQVSVATSTPTATAPITYSGTLGQFIGGVSGAFGCTNASSGVTGCLTGTDWNTFNGKQATISATWPVILTGATLSFGGLSTTTNLTQGQLPYVTGVNTFGQVATTTVSCTGNASCTPFTVIGASPITINASGGTGTGLATTSPVSDSNLLVYSSIGSGSAYGVATTTLGGGTTGLSFSNNPVIIGGSPSVLSGILINANGGTGTSTNGLPGQNVIIGPTGAIDLATSSLFVAPSQFVGVGTTAPTNLFTVEGNQSGGIVNFQRDLPGNTPFNSAVGTFNVTLFESTTTNQFASSTGPTFTFRLATTSTNPVVVGDILGYQEGLTNFGGALGFRTYTGGSINELLHLGANGSSGFGTSTPAFLLHLASSTGAQLTLSDGSSTDAPFNFRAMNGSLSISTSSVTTFATTSTSIALFNTSTGSTTLRRLDVTGGATSTYSGGINLTGGCFSINNACIGAANSGTPGGTGTEIQYRLGASSFGAVASSAFTATAGTLGIGTTTPSWLLQLASSTAPQLTLSDGTATSDHFTLRSVASNFYIATASPSTLATSTTAALAITSTGAKFAGSLTAGNVIDSALSSGFFPVTSTNGLLQDSRLAYSNGGGTPRLTIGTGSDQGSLALTGATSGSTVIAVAAAASGTITLPSLTGNALVGSVVAGGIYSGLGTTTPAFLFQLASSTAAQLALSDGTATSNHWTLRSISNSLFFATASPTTYATSSVAAASFDPNGKFNLRDVVNGWFGVSSPTRYLALQTSTTTSWTGTTSTAYNPAIVAPFTGTIRNIVCRLDASFLGIELDINGTAATPKYAVASTTAGTISLTSGNTIAKGDLITMKFGTTTTSGASAAACTVAVTETP